MRIGILTFHNSYNFGANLQALGSQCAFKHAGAVAEILDFRDEKKLEAYRGLVDEKQAEEHERFSAAYLQLSPPLTTARQVRDYCCDELDAVVVGSDAVFRLAARYQPKRIKRALLRQRTRYSAFGHSRDLGPYWLEWTRRQNGIPVKAALAASSRGAAFYLLAPSLYNRLWSCIKDFDYMTVRDRWTRLMIHWLSLGKVAPQLCPDPVFCLNRAFDFPDSEKCAVNLQNTVLLGGPLGETSVLALRDEAARRGFQTASLANPEDGAILGLDDIGLGLPMSPLTWYHALGSARGYVGTRFHALVSCMVSATPVVTVDISKPLGRRRNIRNPNYDLCSVANTSTRYFLKRTLDRAKPSRVFDILFDESINQRSAVYAGWAADEFLRHVANILDKARV